MNQKENISQLRAPPSLVARPAVPFFPHTPASCSSSIDAACTPITGSMTAWWIAAASSFDLDREGSTTLLREAVRRYVEDERGSYADVYGLLRAEYVGPRGGAVVVIAPSWLLGRRIIVVKLHSPHVSSQK